MIGFVGLSHLGIVSSTAAAARGQQVVAYDSDQGLVDRLREGRLPISEPGLPELLSDQSSNIRFVSDIACLRGCSTIVFSLDVPTDSENRSDLTPLRVLIQNVSSSVSDDIVFVVLSQVPPGFTRTLKRARMFYQVETLVFGSAVERALKPERFIVGCEHPEQPLPSDFDQYLNSFGCPILKMRYESAELSKIAINMFLIASVSMTNTLAEICERIGAEWSEISPALRLDRRIGPHAYLTPGLGIAGGNLERDIMTIQQLSSASGTDTALPQACTTNSRYRKNWVFRILQREVLSQSETPALGILGLSYKPNTASTKNSPALELIDSIAAFQVRAYDPQANATTFPTESVSRVDTALAACQGADAIVIATPWEEFASLDLGRVRSAMTGKVLIDPFRILDADQAREMGFRHFRLGSPE